MHIPFVQILKLIAVSYPHDHCHCNSDLIPHISRSQEMSSLDLIVMTDDHYNNYIIMNVKLIIRARHLHNTLYSCIPHLNSDFKLCMTYWCLSFLSFAKIIADVTDNAMTINIKTAKITIIAAISPAAYITQISSLSVPSTIN